MAAMGVNRMNGLEPQAPAAASDDMQPHAITINFGFTRTQVYAAIFALPSFLGMAMTAGYLYVPAKSEDLRALEKTVTQVEVKLQEITTATKGLTDAVQRLTENVQNLPRGVPQRRKNPQAKR